MTPFCKHISESSGALREGVLNQVGNHKHFSERWDMAVVLTRHESRGAGPKYVCFTYEG
jgi:hypothetical protein